MLKRTLYRVSLLAFAGLIAFASRAESAQFKVGYAKRDITPSKPTPMWGYGSRHNKLSTGILDPLQAKGVVIDVGGDKLAIVGMDIGRGPRESSMAVIRKAVKEASGVNYVLIAGSHTHHGPVTELTDEPGRGKGIYDDAVAYAFELEKRIIDLINEASANAKDAKIGWGSSHVKMNRNRHTKLQPKPVDDELSVLRFDDESGKPIALIVNFAAHPTMLPDTLLKFSADYVGQMKKNVEEMMGTNCIFMQGAAGDMSPNTTAELKTIETFGKAMAEEVVKVAKDVQTKKPESTSIQASDEDFTFTPRVNLQDPAVIKRYSAAFFPELAENFANELKDGKLHPHLTTILLDGDLAIVGASGEFFCNHSNRLKERSRAAKTLFFGYCNGHHMYFPTIEAAAEGGYGADPPVSWVELGGPELMMNKALINLYTMMGKYKFTAGK